MMNSFGSQNLSRLSRAEFSWFHKITTDQFWIALICTKVPRSRLSFMTCKRLRPILSCDCRDLDRVPAPR